MLLHLLLVALAPQAVPRAAAAAEDIVVTGTRKAERRAPLGSRITRPKEVDPRGFVPQIASETGVAGLTPGSGMDPFTGGTRKISIKSCRASDERVSQGALCGLAAIQRRIAAGDHAGAIAAVDRFLQRRDLSRLDRFYAHRFAYGSALAVSDAAARARALEAMVATGLLQGADMLAARRTLVAMALSRGDEHGAVAELERVVALDAADARSRANFAALYVRQGLHNRARPHMAEAVKLATRAGEPVPEAWRAYLAERR